MAVDSGEAAGSGLGLGILAGIVFALAEIVATILAGGSTLGLFRMFASVIAGGRAIDSMGGGLAFLLGLLVHFALSAGFGALYGALFARQSPEVRASPASQAAFGVMFGVAIWLVNFQVIARLAYPWFLDANQFAQAVLHAGFFGLPLGLFFAARERGAQQPGRRMPTSV